MLRIGVTGHRQYDDPDGVERAVDAALVGSVSSPVPSGSGDGSVEVWSSLAEGADRLVARRAIDLFGADLVAVLPLDVDDYRRDFATPGSQDEFARLHGMALRTCVTGPDDSGTRTSAYLRAGLVVAESVDVLLALWDGAPARGEGGTADIVDAARAAGAEIVVVPVTREPAAS